MEGLGIDPIQLGAQIVNFTILVFVLKYFLYTPILNMLEKRRIEIQEGLELKEKIQLKEEKLSETEKQLRKDLREEERRVMKGAVAEAKERQKEILTEAKKEMAEERSKMLAELESERDKMIEQAKKQSIHYAILISEKLLNKKLDAKEQNTLLQEALSDLNK
jgi:F-type H+-transporting ATPase subunit b